MDQVIAVLVIPSEGDPGGLLTEGRKPGAGWRQYEETDPLGWFPDPPWPNIAAYWSSTPPAVGLGAPSDHVHTWALPLWWDGALVPEGWDRARRVVAGSMSHHAREVFAPILHAFAPSEIDGDHREGWELCLWLAVELVRAGLAGRVVRLARVVGRLVEVQP